ncbi:hypothetical protein T439DRAFT_291802 [Meredithblackwellia eburnea MCA 4105]
MPDVSQPRTIDLSLAPNYGDFRDDLARDGFAIIKAAVPPERAEKYRQRAFDWLEKWDIGFKRNKPETWRPENLPVVAKGGMFHHSIGQEAFLWDLRMEPGVINAFSTLWGTNELLVSFDGANISLPGEMQNFEQKPWYHVDQNPTRRGLICAQGLVNLNENGPEDGGLILFKRSSQFNAKFFEEEWDGQEGYIPKGPDAQPDFFGFTERISKWFEDQGCEWVKPSLSPGDLVIWDSRTGHYNLPPRGKRDRVATYLCYAPAAICDPEQLKMKQEIFRKSQMTVRSFFPVLIIRV